MKSILIALLFIALLSYTSASCLTDTEIATINASAINTNVNPDIMINLYERLCNGNRDAVASDIQSFNNSIQTTVSNLRDQMNDNNNNISNQVNTQVNLAVSSVNQSALSTSIQQIAVLYNQTITYNNITAIREYIDNSIALAKGEIYLKMDNQTTSFMTDYNKFKDDTNAIVVKDNNDALSTNRIILLIAG